MGHLKAERPAPATAGNEPLAFDLAGELIGADAITSHFRFQVGRIVSTFGLTETHAQVVVALAFGEGAR
jgi:hypothetical protein